MSDVSWESSEDLEAPAEDALEQHQSLPGEDEEAGEPEDLQVPDEADEADVAEQHQEVKDVEDEDAHR